jgi:hypothetical protein
VINIGTKFMSLDSIGNINIANQIIEILEVWDSTIGSDEITQLDTSTIWDDQDSGTFFLNYAISTTNTWTEVCSFSIKSDLNIFTKELVEDESLSVPMKMNSVGSLYIKGNCIEG